MKQLFFIFLISLTSIICSSQAIVKDLDGQKNTKNLKDKTFSYAEKSLKAVNDSFQLFPGFPVIGSFTTYAPKTGGIMCNLDSDPEEEIIFGCGSVLYALNIDGTNVTGWPFNFPTNYEISWAPASGDIDGDGEIEIVATAGGSTGGNLYAFEKDGSMLSGFPIVFGKFPLGAALSDINNNETLEIIIGKYDYPGGQMYVYKGDGSIFSGWSYDMGEYPASFAAVGDINGDSVPEIIGESRNKLWAWDTAGNVLPGWPFIMDDTTSTIINSYASPVIGNIDQNPDMEIVFCSHDPGGFVFVINDDGSLYPGWPQLMSNWIYAAPMLADLNGDNLPEIIAADQAASATPLNYLHAYDKNGSDIQGFPVGPVYGIYNQPVVADMDADNNWEIIVDANIQNGMEGYYYCFNHNGTDNSEWPLTITGNSYFQQMIFGDPDLNDTLDLFFTGIDLNTSDVYMQLMKTNIIYDPGKIINPVYQFNNQHTGVYPGQTASTGIYEKTISEDFRIWPVPADQTLNLTFQSNSNSDISFSIYDVLGNKLQQNLTINNSQKGTYFKQLDISNLKSGTYLIIANQDNARHTKIFVKQ